MRRYTCHKCFINYLTFQTEKNTTNCAKMCQVILPLIKGMGSLSACVGHLSAISNTSNAADMATATRHTDTIEPAQPS
jgi:hypothetical protein